MNHATLPRFWKRYALLPFEVQKLADKNYELLKRDPWHPSLHFKKIGSGNKSLWSVRIGRYYRALARQHGDSIVWFWIGPHSEYDKLIG